MARGRARQLGTSFLALSTDFITASSDTLGSRRVAHAGVEKGYPLKSSYFTAIGLLNVETLADRRRHAAYHNEH